MLKQLKTLFFTGFRLSAFTFGGGFVIIPLMRRQYVEKLHWIDEQEMMDYTAIAQSAPGPIAVNAAILVGWRIAGLPGALVSVLGTILPPLIIISVISFFYKAFSANRIVRMVMAGMMAGVAAVIFDVVVTMAKSVLKDRRILPALMIVGAFAAKMIFNVNIILILFACGIISAADTLIRSRKEGKV